MRRRFRLSMLAATLLLPIATVAASVAAQHGPARAGALQVRNAHAAATAPGQPVGAAYLSLVSPRRAELISVSSDAAARVEIHHTSTNEGVMTCPRGFGPRIPGRWLG